MSIEIMMHKSSQQQAQIIITAGTYERERKKMKTGCYPIPQNFHICDLFSRNLDKVEENKFSDLQKYKCLQFKL